MGGRIELQLGRLVVTPFVTIGVIAAVLVWEVEHVRSFLLAGLIASGGVIIGIMMARRVRRRIDELSDHYGALLRRADEQSRRAEAANRVKDEFLATLSHELRTPLNSVLGWTHLLASGKLDEEQTTKAIQAIERAGWAQSRLIDDLLDISRIVRGRLQITVRPTLVGPPVDAAVQSLKPAAQAKRIRVETSVDSDIPAIAADPDRLQQIVWNLLSNAIKFTPPGGRVAVRASLEPQQARLTVSDTGIGFTPEVAAHLFEDFRQGDSSPTRMYGGLGLGLSIVRHLVELHGGTVAAESAGKNQGAVLTVCLPLATVPETASVDVQPVAEPAPFLRGISVLVVDDDRQMLEFVRSALERYGALVATASSAREARARFDRDPPDVLVADLLLPGEDGLELIRTIRRSEAGRDRHTPAAALTALARSEDRRRALEAGFELHVVKPIDPNELAWTVERLAHQSRDDHNHQPA